MSPRALILVLAIAVLLASLARLPQVVEGVAMLEPGRPANGPTVAAKVTRPIGWTPDPIVPLPDTAGEPRLIRVERVRVDMTRLAIWWGALVLVTAVAISLAPARSPNPPSRT